MNQETQIKKSKLYNMKSYLKNDVYKFMLNLLNDIQVPTTYTYNEICSSVINDAVSNYDILDALINLQEKDLYTFNHSINVAIFSFVFAVKLQLDEQQIESLFKGCLLHDIGKIYIPISIINKPSKLTEEEYLIIKQHPYLGSKHYTYYNDLNIRDIILQHHEHYDGTGYPHNLKGSQINLLSQISSICDVYDALSSERSYKKPCSIDFIIEYFTLNKEKIFNKDLTIIFISLISSSKLKRLPM